MGSSPSCRCSATIQAHILYSFFLHLTTLYTTFSHRISASQHSDPLLRTHATETPVSLSQFPKPLESVPVAAQTLLVRLLVAAPFLPRSNHACLNQSPLLLLNPEVKTPLLPSTPFEPNKVQPRPAIKINCPTRSSFSLYFFHFELSVSGYFCNYDCRSLLRIPRYVTSCILLSSNCEEALD